MKCRLSSENILTFCLWFCSHNITRLHDYQIWQTHFFRIIHKVRKGMWAFCLDNLCFSDADSLGRQTRMTHWIGTIPLICHYVSKLPSILHFSVNIYSATIIVHLLQFGQLEPHTIAWCNSSDRNVLLNKLPVQGGVRWPQCLTLPSVAAKHTSA